MSHVNTSGQNTGSGGVSREILTHCALLLGLNIVAAALVYFLGSSLVTADGSGAIGISDPQKLYHFSFVWIFANLAGGAGVLLAAWWRAKKGSNR